MFLANLMYFVVEALEEVPKSEIVQVPPVIPNPHVDVPIWAVPLIVAAFIAMIGYVWHRLEDRIRAIERAREDVLKEDHIGKAENQIKVNTNRLDTIEREIRESMRGEIAQGGFLTLKEHAEFCATVCQRISKDIQGGFEKFEDILDLKLENLRLAVRSNRRADVGRKDKKRGSK